MRDDTTQSKVCRLIKVATGEEYGDGYIVSDLAIGYAEPGYGADDAVIVFGNWNDKRWARAGDPPPTKEERLPSRLGDAIERAGGHIEWSDEWGTCTDCYRALRTQADSYSWTMFGAYVDDCELVCADCMRADVERYIDDGHYVNDPRKAIVWASASDLEAIGFEHFERNNPHTYASGWYEGQDDDPTTILAEVHREFPSADVVFLISDVGQFDVHFQAFYRVTEDESTDDD